MKTILKVTIGLLVVVGAAAQARAQGTAFTYQGRLNDSGLPANGIYDLQFTIYDSAGGATMIAGPLTGPGVPVTNGLFTASLDFGTSVFTGPARWLQIAVRTNGGGSFVPLNPRQALTPAPYAIFAATASNVVSGSVVKSVNGLKDNVTLAAGANVTLTPSGNTITIASTAGGVGETNSLWSLNGANAYYNAGNVGIGTATPAYRLDVGGRMRVRGAGGSGAGIFFTESGTPTSDVSFFGRGADDQDWTGLYASDWRFVVTDSGNVGIGTTSPLSKLHLFDPVDSVTHVLQSGGGVNAWAKVAFNNPNGQWDIGTSRSFNNDVFYIDRNGTSALEFQLSTSGALGLGIEPQSKLHLYEPADSVSQRIQTGGGVNAWTRVELINANGQWDIGTSRGFNGDQLYFNRPGFGIAFGLQPNGNAYVAGNVGIGTGTPADKLYIAGEAASGYAIGIEGNARQNRDKGGWVKAMAYVHGISGTIYRSYNPFGTTTVSVVGSGHYRVDFAFQVDDRFVSVTPHYGAGGTQSPNNMGANFTFTGATTIDVLTYDANDGEDTFPASFMIIIY